jgi:hypothetical protein
MSFPYTNPISASRQNFQLSLDETSNFGVTYSVANTGGYMEVANLSDLVWNFSGQTGFVTGSTIPIQFYKGTGTGYSPDILTLNSDYWSTGRRRLGMLAYVYETNTFYQYQIDNYQTIWNNATGATNTVIFTDYGANVRSTTSQGVDLINAWTGSTIEGQNGATRNDSNWIIFNGSYPVITGGTYSGNTLVFTTNTGSLIQVTGITSGSGAGVTGGTLDYDAGNLELYNATGGTVTITGLTDTFITGGITMGVLLR